MDAKQENQSPSSLDEQTVSKAHQKAAEELTALSGLWGPANNSTVPVMQIVQAVALINIGNQLTRLADLAERAAGQP